MAMAKKGSDPMPSFSTSGERALDDLVYQFQTRREPPAPAASNPPPDPIEVFRKQLVSTLIPTFVEISEKYAASGIAMEMDASKLLGGGREIQFRFSVGQWRTELLGTVTSDVLAFQEIRHTPEMQGEITSGPMLRLRRLNAEIFREFICERLAMVLRSAIRRR